jgi:two-component system, NtrC family, response regulator GlrR
MSSPDPIGPHILVVDDDEDLCELLEIRLQHHGFRVTTEHNSRDAIEVLEREVVDAMLLDLRLDNENGLDLLTETQNRSLDLPVVILTAHGSIDTAVEAMKRGAYGFLTKPFDDHELLQKLEHAVERVRLRRELGGLRRIVGEPSSGERLLGTSAAIAAVRDLIARIAPSEASVLILGESGTGKEVAARSIHNLSPRHDKPFIALNCGALPAELLESELFGYKRGAFTGAVRDKEGLFAAAEGGTLFLDEIGDAPPAVQVKLLRVLQERAYLPVGGTQPRTANVRILAATNRDLQADVDAGRFREDLFYRLHVVPIVMPPLRERREDIPLLTELFLARGTAQHGITRPHLAHDALHILMHHDWPGNVRELANVVQGAALLSTDGVLRPAHVLAVLPRRSGEPPASPAGAPQSAPLAPRVAQALDPETPLPPLREARETFDRAYLEEALRRSGGNVSAAAKMSGRNRTDFHDLLRRYQIDANRFRE